MTLFLLMFCYCLPVVAGHGYLVEPAARNSMWRFGFDNPKNYNDNQLFCGGLYRQWVVNKGACGACGDPADGAQLHNDGGKWGNKIITKTYKQGEVIEITLRLTQSHKGTFEFRIGDFSESQTAGDEMGKLRGEILYVVGGGGFREKSLKEKFVVPPRTGLYKIQLQLPPQLHCERCVVQWWYRAGNNWGCDDDGCGVGHGPQEHYVNCADVKIIK